MFQARPTPIVPWPAQTVRWAIDFTLRPPVMGKVSVWAKTDSTSYFKDYMVSPR